MSAPLKPDGVERVELLTLRLQCSRRAHFALARRDLDTARWYIAAAEELARQYEELPPRGTPGVPS